MPGSSQATSAPSTRSLRLSRPPIELLPALARQYDEPIGDSSMLPTYLVSRLIRRHATVALGGDGGDELFGGYFHYGCRARHDRLRRAHAGARCGASPGAFAAAALPVGVRGRNYLIGLSRDVRWTIAHINVFFDRRSRARLLAEPAPKPLLRLVVELLPETWRVALCNQASLSPLQQATAGRFSDVHGR